MLCKQTVTIAQMIKGHSLDRLLHAEYQRRELPVKRET
ncbi:Transposase [Shigella boydii ATCC 9905]|nr:Transposase [Shigella boydii ATCC 9905]